MKVSLLLAAGNLCHRHFTFLESNFLTGRDLICHVMKRPSLTALCKYNLKLCPEKNCLAHFLLHSPILHCPSTPTPLLLPPCQPDDLQVQKVFWEHKSCLQTVAVNIEISNLVHSGHPLSWRQTSRSLHPKEPLDHQPAGQDMKVNLSDYFFSFKNSNQNLQFSL